MSTLYHNYINYKNESNFFNYKPNNIIHFIYLYYFTNYKQFI